MTIVLMVPEMDTGGVEQGTEDLARGFLRRGHSVAILAAGGRRLAGLRELGAVCHRLPLHRKDPVSVCYSYLRTRLLFLRTRPEIVHARSRVPALVGYLATRGLTGVHFVTSFHSFYNRHFPSRIMGSGELVIAVSRAVAEDARLHFGVRPVRVRVVYNGVALRAAPRAPGGPGEPVRLGVLGRMADGKGFPEFLRTIELLGEGRRVIGVAGIGVSAENRRAAEAFIARVRQSPAAGRIHVLLNPSPEEFFGGIDVYAGCFTVPEGFGRVLVEAQLAGLPVVASAIGASPEIIEDGVTGFLAAPDPRSFAAVLEPLIADTGLRRRVGEAGRAAARERFSVDRMVEATLAVYEELAANANCKVKSGK